MEPTSGDAGLVFLFLQSLSHSMVLSSFNELPPQVYHYTNAAGFAGILNDNEIWATNFSFLNDPSEIEYGLTTALETLSSMHGSASADQRELLKHTHSALAGKVLWQPYLACFSKHSDDISQWRAYGSEALERYCLGFDADALASFLSLQPTMRFAKVLYKKDEQAQRIRWFAEQAFGFVRKNAIDASNWDAVGSVVADILVWILPEIKDPAYECEAEWRIVWKAEDRSDLPRFDSARGTLRPYVPIHLPTPIPISEVRVLAPSRTRMAMKAADMLLLRAGVGLKSRNSAVPFAD